MLDGALALVFPPPPVDGLGTVGGFKLQIQDRADLGYEALDNVVKAVTGQAYINPMLTGIFSSYNIDTPQLFVVPQDVIEAQKLRLAGQQESFSA